MFLIVLAWEINYFSLFLAIDDSKAYPTLYKYKDQLKPGSKFKEIELIEGWIIVKNDDPKETGATWSLRDEKEITEQRIR